MEKTVWIARHGNRQDFVTPEWFETAPRRYDPPLSADGHTQAQELAERLREENIRHIFASPFLRAIQTAHPASVALGLPIKIEAGLSEWLNEEWMTENPETEPLADLAAAGVNFDLSHQSVVVPNYPEASEVLAQRTAATVQKLVDLYDQDILLVGHGVSVAGTALGLVKGNPHINAALCCLVKVVSTKTGWNLELNGDTSHLSQTETKIRFN
ncbi:MAG: histidine phosphatase family protein [Cyanobacteria bacterium P01_H01_bin.15]